MASAPTGRARIWLSAAASAARFALAAIDGSVVAVQADRGVTLERLLQPLVPALVPALVASRRALLAEAGHPREQAAE